MGRDHHFPDLDSDFGGEHEECGLGLEGVVQAAAKALVCGLAPVDSGQPEYGFLVVVVGIAGFSSFCFGFVPGVDFWGGGYDPAAYESGSPVLYIFPRLDTFK